jgi:hypothetical protein
MAASDFLYTTVRNTSGAARFFGFLGPHGKKLAANEEYSVPGDLVAVLGGKTSRRSFNALVRAFDNSTIAIVKTPSPFVVDAADAGQTVTLGASDNAPASTDYYDSNPESEA